MVDVDEFLDNIYSGELTVEEILAKFENGELNGISLSDMRDIIYKIMPQIKTDEQRMVLIESIKDSYEDFTVIIIRELENEENIIKYLDLLTGKQKVDIAINNLKEDSKKIKLLEQLEGTEIGKSKGVLIKASLSREGYKKYFLPEDENRSTEIGIDPNITYGIEIESIGRASIDLIDVGDSNGIVIDDKGQERGKILRHYGEDERFWTTVGDASLTSGSGIEVVSPIFKDEPEDIEDIYMACNMLQEANQEIGNCCGGHVHIGSDYLTTKESYANLYEIFGNSERILYIISNEEGDAPRYGIRKTCRTNITSNK